MSVRTQNTTSAYRHIPVLRAASQTESADRVGVVQDETILVAVLQFDQLWQVADIAVVLHLARTNKGVVQNAEAC